MANAENAPLVVETPTLDNVNYPRYNRRIEFFRVVTNLYFLLRDYPHYTIRDWFPVIYRWAVSLSLSSDGTVLVDEMFADAFYHGVAHVQPNAFADLRDVL